MAASQDRDAAAAETRLTIEVGDPLSDEGLTRVALDGAGEFSAELIRKGPSPRADQYKAAEPIGPVRGRMPAPQALDLIRRSQQFAWGRAFPSRPGIPDEAVVVWRLEQPGGETRFWKAWLRDVEQDSVAGPVLDALRRQLAELSNDRLYL
ncbi:MAG: hypothetical protein HYU37_22610 [Acidobacteria bacterium]|nr:hypothetical protein [Acidobacteriota bacterium]